MARGRQRSGFPVGRKTDYEWTALSALQSSILIAAGTTASTILSVSSESLTLYRLRGRVYAQLDAGGTNERATIMCGIAVVGPVQTVFPAPFTNRSFGGWLWTGVLAVSALAEGTVSLQALFDRIEIDSKAMRKMKVGERLVFVSETVAVSAAGGTIDIMMTTSALSGA